MLTSIWTSESWWSEYIRYVSFQFLDISVSSLTEVSLMSGFQTPSL